MRLRSLLLSLVCSLLLSFWPLAASACGGVAVYRSTDYDCSSGGWCYIPFGEERWDDSDFHTSPTNNTRLTVPSDCEGWYTISGSIYMTDPGGTYYRYLYVKLNGSTWICSDRRYAAGGANMSIACNYYLDEGDYIELSFYHNAGSDVTIKSYGNYSPEFRMVKIDDATSICGHQIICGIPGNEVFLKITDGNWIYSGFAHADQHEDGGYDEINVTGLSGLLSDTQDAGWFHGLAITVTGVSDGQALTWNATEEEWQPATISGTGGYTMPGVITATISGTVPVFFTMPVSITDTWHITETLSSGHDVALIRSFTYGEASIAIALFALLAFLGTKWIFELVRQR